MVKHFNADNFETEVLQAKGTVFVKFSSPTCGPCRMMIPVLEKAAEKWQKVSFGEVNVATDRSLAMRYGIMAVPTLMLFENGELKAQFTGYMDLDDMQEYFGAWLNG